MKYKSKDLEKLLTSWVGNGYNNPVRILTKEDLDATELAIRAIKNEYSKEYYKNNKDKVKARRLKFYAENKERLQKTARKKYAEMPAWRKAKYNERHTRYRQENKEKIAAKAKERYRLKKSNTTLSLPNDEAAICYSATI